MNVLESYNELKLMLEALELDATKNQAGTAAAGVRLRKGLRMLKKASGELVKLSNEHSKEMKASK